MPASSFLTRPRPNPLAARTQISRETQINLAQNKSRVRPKWRACSQATHEKISIISLLSSLSLKLYLNSLVYHRKIFGSFSEIFGNFRKFPENVRVRSSGLPNNFRKSSEIFGNRMSESGRKSSENHQKSRHHWLICNHWKRTLHVSLRIWILCSRGKNNISRKKVELPSAM